jgi:hypothetical protein
VRTPAGRARLAAALIALLGVPAVAHANGESYTGPPTVFERFVLSACSPCVRDSYPVAAIAVAPAALPAFPAGAAGVANRPGELKIEVVRAQQLGRRDWMSLALRVVLSVKAGGASEMFRLGIGLLDGAEVRPLVAAVGEMIKLAAAPASSGAEATDVDFHGGSLRIGILRLRSDTVAYVQAGDLPLLMQRAVWEVPTTLYLPVRELPTLAAALTEAAARLERVRSEP